MPASMTFKTVVVIVLVGITLADPGGYGHGGGGGGHGGGGYGGGGGHGGGGYGGPMPYSFGYNVHGHGYKGPSFGQHEKSNGHGNVHGSYSVALPDGRKQHVSYSADHYKGFVAKVSYSGKAQHPSYYGPAITFGHGGGGYGGGGGGGYH